MPWMRMERKGRVNEMSGGSLNYFFGELEDHSGDFGDRELDELVKDLAKLFHDREWYLSADTCEGAWNESRDAFKRKWFAEGARAERIEKYMSDVKDEMLKSFGISNKYCKNCKHWTEPNKEVSSYGKCDFFEGSCLKHRSESCERFEER